MHTRVSRVRNGLALAVMLIVMGIVILTHEMANQHDMNYYYIFIPLWMSLLLSSHHSFTSRGNKLFSIRHAHTLLYKRIGDTMSSSFSSIPLKLAFSGSVINMTLQQKTTLHMKALHYKSILYYASTLKK